MHWKILTTLKIYVQWGGATPFKWSDPVGSVSYSVSLKHRPEVAFGHSMGIFGQAGYSSGIRTRKKEKLTTSFS